MLCACTRQEMADVATWLGQTMAIILLDGPAHVPVARDTEMWNVLNTDGLPTRRTIVRAADGDPAANLVNTAGSSMCVYSAHPAMC